MRTALLLILLLAIASCTTTTPEPTPLNPNTTQTPSPSPNEPIPPTPRAQDLQQPDCTPNQGRAADLCNFEITVNGTISTMNCLEQNTACAKDRDYATCIAAQDSFGCRANKAQDLAACDRITNTSIAAPCRLYASFAHDDIQQCNKITEPAIKDICLQGFLDRSLDCTTFNYPCRTTHTLTSDDCQFTDKALATACKGIATKNEKTCQESNLPICELVFSPTFSYTTDGTTYSGLIKRPELDTALEWITTNTPPDATILAHWDHGHSIRSTTGRRAVAYNPPITFQPGIEDAKQVIHIGDELNIKDLPYYDTKRFGPQATQEEGYLIASVLTATKPQDVLPNLKSRKIEYILASVTDSETMPLLAALNAYDESQTPLIDLMNTLAPIEGLTLVYNDTTTSVYKVN